MANRGDPRLKRAYRDGFRTKILQRDGYVCFYCGQDADQVDHVIPISKAPELVVSPDNAVVDPPPIAVCCRLVICAAVNTWPVVKVCLAIYVLLSNLIRRCQASRIGMSLI